MIRFISITLLFLCFSAPHFSYCQNSPWWSHAVFYEIFVRSFQDSNGDGIGDLNGITSRLDYLKSLGISGIWLTPIFKSPSYHGYDAIDYKAINPEYGTLDDFKHLIASAHQRGIRVILDIAINHTSSQHPWFVDAASNPRSPHRDRYVWKSADPQWPGHHWHLLNGAYYYTFFGASMPDLNWLYPPVMDSVKDLFNYWSTLGVDGFRLDAARYYVEGPQGEPDTSGTHQTIQTFTQYVKGLFPGRFFVGEIWADSNIISTYINSGDQLDLAFDFPVSFGLQNSLKNQSGTFFRNSVMQSFNAATSQNSLAPFITNHDMIRVASVVSGQMSKLKLAAAALLTLPGTPFLYYGEEIGLPNGNNETLGKDQNKRTPMPWDNTPERGFTTPGHLPWWPFSSDNPDISVSSEVQNPGSLLNTYRALIRLRNKEIVLQTGLLGVPSQSDNRLAIYARANSHEIALIVLNFSSETITTSEIKIPKPAGSTSYHVTPLWGSSNLKVTVSTGNFDITFSAVQPLRASLFKISF